MTVWRMIAMTTISSTSAFNPRTGQVNFTKLACKCRDQIIALFAALPRPQVVAIESVGFYRWLWDLLEPIVERLLLADAAHWRGGALTER